MKKTVQHWLPHSDKKIVIKIYGISAPFRIKNYSLLCTVMRYFTTSLVTPRETVNHITFISFCQSQSQLYLLFIIELLWVVIIFPMSGLFYLFLIHCSEVLSVFFYFLIFLLSVDFKKKWYKLHVWKEDMFFWRKNQQNLFSLKALKIKKWNVYLSIVTRKTKNEFNDLISLLYWLIKIFHKCIKKIMRKKKPKLFQILMKSPLFLQWRPMKTYILEHKDQKPFYNTREFFQPM